MVVFLSEPGCDPRRRWHSNIAGIRLQSSTALSAQLTANGHVTDAMDPSVAAHCLTEDHVSPLLEGETLRNAARRLLQEDEGHGSLGLLHHLHHALLQLGHQRAQMLPPVACGMGFGMGKRGV